MNRVGFLTFGNWQRAAWSKTPSAADALRQTIELAETAEELGVDGAYVRVHHCMRKLAAPFPLLAAIAARTSRIEIGTGVIDLRYENPLYGRGGRRGRSDQRGPPATWNEPRLARAGAARRGDLRIVRRRRE